MVLPPFPPVAASAVLQPPLPLVLGDLALLRFEVAALEAVIVDVVVEEDLDAVEGELLEAHRLLLVAASGRKCGLEQWIGRLEIVELDYYSIYDLQGGPTKMLFRKLKYFIFRLRDLFLFLPAAIKTQV